MIGSILSWGSLILNITKNLTPDNKNISDAKDVVDNLGSAYDLAKLTSVTKSANSTVIRPMVVIDESILHQEYMTDLLTIIQLRDIEAVLSHINLQSTVGGIRLQDVVAGVNPKRGGMMAYQGLESFGDTKPENAGKPVRIGADNSKQDLTEYFPLALGRTVQASMTIDRTPLTFPLSFRQIPIPTDYENLQLTFSAAKIEDAPKLRTVMWKVGDLTTPELLNGTDIIKQKFKIRDKEMTGYYEEATKRESNNRKEAIRTGTISMNSVANAFVLSSHTASRIEVEIGLRFDKESQLAKIFSRVKANRIVIVNEDRSVFTFYTDGLGMPEVYTRNELKTKVKKSDVDSLEALTKLLNGR